MPNEVRHAGMQAGSSDHIKRQERVPDPCIVVIFGASGDLTKRKLLPALFHLEQRRFAAEGLCGGGRGAPRSFGDVRRRHAGRHREGRRRRGGRLRS